VTFEVWPDEVSNSTHRGEVSPAPDALVPEPGAISVVETEELLTRDEGDTVGPSPIQPIGEEPSSWMMTLIDFLTVPKILVELTFRESVESMIC
jgi:hypothetical protein